MKRLLLKSMLLLCALIVGSSNVWADTYVKVTSNSDLVSGDVYIIATSGAIATSFSDNVLNTTSSGFTESSGTITTTTATPMEFILGITSEKYTLKNGSDYLGYPNSKSSKTNLRMSQTVSTDTKEQWTIASDATYGYTIVNVANTGRFVGTGANAFKAYASMSANAPATLYRKQTTSSDPSSDISFASATPSLDLKDAATYTQVATTASGYSSTPGASVTYSIGATNTALATINPLTGVVTPTQAGSVVVEAAAAAIDGHYAASYASYTLTVSDTRVWTVTCHIGNNTSNVNRTSGDALELDAPAAICGMSFVGWSSTDNVVSPTWVANTTTVTTNMELYAIFEAVAGEYSYHLVEASQDDWRGDYLIAYSSKIFADGRTGGESGIGKKEQSVDPTTNLNGKVVDVTWGDTYNVTIEAKNDSKLSDGYLLKTKDGKYNYRTNNSNGIALTETRATAAAYPLSITFTSSSNIGIANSSGAVFHYNTDGYFRFYSSGGQSSVYLYKRTEDVAPVYSLGTTETITPSYAKITYVTPEIMDFSNVPGLKAYVATDAAAAGVTMTRVETAVPEGTPLLLIGTAGTTYNVPIIASATVPATNKLVAGDGATDMSGVSGYNYILYSDGLFYQVTSGTIATTKAYLHLTSDPTAGGARSLDIVFDDETTGIDATLVNSEKVNSDVYDLQGRKVAQPTKGLYIVNGKKVIIK